MSGRMLPAGDASDSEPWASGSKTVAATLVLAPNPSAWTLDGTNTWLVSSPGSGQTIVVDPGPADLAHLELIVDRALAVDSPVTMILLTHGHADHSAGFLRHAQCWRLSIRFRKHFGECSTIF